MAYESESNASVAAIRSTDGRTALCVHLWEPAQGIPLAGTLQLVHGMAEHAARYAEFARLLNACGYAVAIHDQVGHGRSVRHEGELGHLPHGGADVLIDDAALVSSLAEERWPGVPHFLMGHSMGSFVARLLAAKQGERYAGAIFCGTADQDPIASAVGHGIAQALCVLRGSKYRSPLLEKFGTGAFNADLENPRTPLDWLSFDPDNVDAYIADPLCGFPFSAGGYAALTDLTRRMVREEAAAAVPDDLPLLLIAGEDDPVGECGEGPCAAAERFAAHGCIDVSLILYPGMRHEILNEVGHELVEADILEWLSGHNPLR